MTEFFGLLLLAPLFACWIVLTIRHAKPRGARDLSVYGPFGLLIPSWNFFAPNPGVHDYYLLFRDYLMDGEAGPWRNVDSFSNPRRWTTCVWNPDKLEKKALFDVVMALVQELPEELRGSSEPMPPGSFEYLKLSIPYIALTHYILTAPRSPLSASRQFLIMRGSKTDDRVETFMVSGQHGW
jgi:hypothetical protein